MIIKLKRFRVTARAAIVSVVLGGSVTFLAGFLVFAAKVPRAAEPLSEITEAIVVLTGGSERLRTGLRLLEAGWAEKMFVSGVPEAVGVRALLAVSEQESEKLYTQIEIGHEARDTVGNARETEKWMMKQGFKSLRLVTAGYHMLRSLREFSRVMPGIRIVPYPVFPETVHLDNWWQWPGTTALLFDEYVKFLASYFRAAMEPGLA